MSLVRWEEPKPCALSRPRFIKIVPRDAFGRPIGEAYTKRIGRPTCASGLPATSSVSVNGVVHHLCIECGRADLLAVIEQEPAVPQATVPAAPAVAREGDLVLVRVGRDTAALTAKLVASGYAAKARVRTVKRDGFLTSRVSVWERA